LDERTFVVFIKDAPGQKELKGAGEVHAIPGEDRGRVRAVNPPRDNRGG
jgi:hypothetical protein